MTRTESVISVTRGTQPDARATPDRVVVRVAAPLDLPIAPPSWSGTPVVSASAAAYVVVSQ